MNRKKEVTLIVVMMISAAVFVSGLGYIYVFSGLLGNTLPLSPVEMDGGIQYSPENCDCDYQSQILCEIIYPECKV